MSERISDERLAWFFARYHNGYDSSNEHELFGALEAERAKVRELDAEIDRWKTIANKPMHSWRDRAEAAEAKVAAAEADKQVAAEAERDRFLEFIRSHESITDRQVQDWLWTFRARGKEPEHE